MDDNNENVSTQEYQTNLIETVVKMIGDQTVIRETVRLIAYIRHAIKNNLKTDINVKIGNNIANAAFTFDVNGFEVPDYITKDTIEIN